MFKRELLELKTSHDINSVHVYTMQMNILIKLKDTKEK